MSGVILIEDDGADLLIDDDAPAIEIASVGVQGPPGSGGGGGATISPQDGNQLTLDAQGRLYVAPDLLTQDW